MTTSLFDEAGYSDLFNAYEIPFTMMKYFPFRLMKRSGLETLQQENATHRAQIISATEFVKEIAKGNLEAVYREDSTLTNQADNILSHSLMELSTQLKKLSLEEKQRNWVTESRAKFIDILRSRNDDMRALAENIITNLVKTMRANQGALYLVNEEQDALPHIEIAACYAYERKKYLSQRIESGEGLVGQCVLEKASIYMTDIPANYLRITSGLGEASPKNLLIVPLKLEEKVFGVVEIASFEIIKPYEIEFLEQLGESIASTISIAKINQQTQKMLRESQAQAEQMRLQEEVMRQSMEELSTTQEEMQRVLREVQQKEQYMNELMNVSKDAIVAIDRHYQIISYNQALADGVAAMGLGVEKGSNYLQFYPETEHSTQQALFEKAFSGENFELTQTFTSPAGEVHLLFNYCPIRNEQEEVIAIAIYSKNISEIINARKETERHLHASQQQTEELKAQEEELRQNMEELSATQEEMQRILLDVQNKEQYLKEVLDVSNDAILTIDKDYRLISGNKAFMTHFEEQGTPVGKGFDILQIFHPEEKKKKIALYERIFAGESFEETEHLTVNGLDHYFRVRHAPLRNQHGEIIALAIFTKDVTEQTKAHMQIEQLLREAKTLDNGKPGSQKK
jgi:PAS domain S-box-containing protein